MKNYTSEVAQISKPYESTIKFERFLKNHKVLYNSQNVLDLGTGIGSNLFYFKENNKKINFTGVDYNSAKINFAKKILKLKKDVNNIYFETADWMKLPIKYKNKFDGVINIHTLCCFKKLEPAIKAIIKIKPKWIAFNSLFYEGPLDALIHIRDHREKPKSDSNPDGDFNIFSLPLLTEIFYKYDYQVNYKKFHLGKKIIKPINNQRGTYTVRTEWGNFTQFSGPVHLPWYFVLAKKI